MPRPPTPPSTASPPRARPAAWHGPSSCWTRTSANTPLYRKILLREGLPRTRSGPNKVLVIGAGIAGLPAVGIRVRRSAYQKSPRAVNRSFGIPQK
ncbi:hypothetical protein [Streptomyces sp. NPDC002851]